MSVSMMKRIGSNKKFLECVLLNNLKKLHVMVVVADGEGKKEKRENLHHTLHLKGKDIFLENIHILIFFSRFIDKMNVSLNRYV